MFGLRRVVFTYRRSAVLVTCAGSVRRGAPASHGEPELRGRLNWTGPKGKSTGRRRKRTGHTAGAGEPEARRKRDLSSAGALVFSAPLNSAPLGAGLRAS